MDNRIEQRMQWLVFFTRVPEKKLMMLINILNSTILVQLY